MWKWLLPAVCATVTAVMVVTLINIYGFGSKPWLGFFDDVTTPSAPYTQQVSEVVRGGAMARAGVREGDTIDLRELPISTRVALVPGWQPMSTIPLTFTVHRNGKPIEVRFTASTIYDGSGAALKVGTNVIYSLAMLWALACAWLIAIRRWQLREARYLCLMLLTIPLANVSPGNSSWPNAATTIAQSVLYGITTCAPPLLLVFLAARLSPGYLPRLLKVLTVIATATTFAGCVIGAFGVATLRIDPLPYTLEGAFWVIATEVSYVIAVVAAVVATARAKQSERARIAWLLLPLPIALLLFAFGTQVQAQAATFFQFMALGAILGGVLLLGALAVTYALLKRRVLDFQFIASRALVVASISTLVIVSFVLLEWLLGSVLADASHATGVVANAGLALGLGLSMRFIHSRVDKVIDFAFFHKRRENERALHDFAREATFITKSDALFDQAIDRVSMHTDTVSASVLVADGPVYRAERSYGEQTAEIQENDPAILALKAHHRPIDPHLYTTALRGDIALPMLARGQLLGVLVLGARASGEAFAPDEIEALGSLAHGLGSALESVNQTESARAGSDAIVRELRALRTAVDTMSAQFQA